MQLTLIVGAVEQPLNGSTVAGPFKLVPEVVGCQEAIIRLDGRLTHSVDPVRQEVCAYLLDEIKALENLAPEELQTSLVNLQKFRLDLVNLQSPKLPDHTDLTADVHQYLTVVKGATTFECFDDFSFTLRLGESSVANETQVLEPRVTQPHELFQPLITLFGAYTGVASAAVGFTNFSSLSAGYDGWHAIGPAVCEPTPKFRPVHFYFRADRANGETERHLLDEPDKTILLKGGRELYAKWLPSGEFRVSWKDEGEIERLKLKWIEAQDLNDVQVYESSESIRTLKNMIAGLEEKEQKDAETEERLALLTAALASKKQLRYEQALEFQKVPTGEGWIQCETIIAIDQAVTAELTYPREGKVPVFMVIKDTDAKRAVSLQFPAISKADVKCTFDLDDEGLSALGEVFTPVPQDSPASSPASSPRLSSADQGPKTPKKPKKRKAECQESKKPKKVREPKSAQSFQL